MLGKSVGFIFASVVKDAFYVAAESIFSSKSFCKESKFIFMNLLCIGEYIESMLDLLIFCNFTTFFSLFVIQSIK